MVPTNKMEYLFMFLEGGQALLISKRAWHSVTCNLAFINYEINKQVKNYFFPRIKPEHPKYLENVPTACFIS